MHTEEITPEPSLQSSLSVSSCDRLSRPLIICVILFWTHSSMSLSVLHWRAQNWSQHSLCVSPALSKGEGSPPQPIGNTSNAAQGVAGHLCSRAILLAHVQFVVPQETQVVFLLSCSPTTWFPFCPSA